AAGFAALGWRGAEAQRRALAAETRSLTARVNEMAARQHRAWVHATAALDGPMIVKSRAVSLSAHYRLDNSGDAPATEIRIAAAVVPHDAGDIAQLQRSLCARPPAEGDSGLEQDTLFPGQHRDIRRVEGIGADLVAGGGAQSAAAGVEFWWVGCVAYRSAGSPAEHRSGFIYALAESGAGPGGIVPIGLADRIIPKARLAVIAHAGGFPAD
ncbi:MAG TPA: hypothetical protein VJR70_11085, partial [Stellaceae bacterium]|nr:hypothetical protein [Stellaceae bacterium]